MRSGRLSEWRHATRGRPQGSNLGPLFWNIFQNDLARSSVPIERLSDFFWPIWPCQVSVRVTKYATL